MRIVLPIVAIVAVAGCGDPILCKSDVFVAIQTTKVTEDLDNAQGVQTDLRVRTSLDEGEVVEVTILDDKGQIDSTASQAVDAYGNATLRVTVPTPRATVRAFAESECGEGRDEVSFDVLASIGCTLAITPVPEENDFYAPLRVLRAGTDPEPDVAGFQASVSVATRGDWVVDLYTTSVVGEELVGTSTVTDGVARFAETLREGQVGLRAICRNGPGTSSQSSLVTAVYVDTVPPECSITVPGAGATITPALDTDHDLSNGVQLEVEVHGTGPDLLDEPFSVTAMASGGSPMSGGGVLGSDGNGSTVVTLPATSNVTYDFTLGAQDHAFNACSTTQPYTVVLDGCDIAITSPSAPVTSDVDGNGGNGVQVDVGVQVAAACAGRTVTSTCGSNPSATVPVSGSLTLRPTVCATSPCEATVPCSVSVTTMSGVTTTASTNLAFDNLAPDVDVAVVNPALACGSSVSPANDADPVTDGVQVGVSVTSPTGSMKQLVTANDNGTSTVDATSDVIVTLAPGANSFVGKASDALGNVGSSAACTLSLSDLSVSFSAPAADGLVNENDGTVSGTDLTFPFCGTVNKSGSTVTVAIDGMPPQPATVTGTSWCRTITVAQTPPAHTIVVNAISGGSMGTGTLVLAVDVVDPDAVTDLTAASPDRQNLNLAWTAPAASADHYLLKVSTTALTDANFESTGVALPVGMPQSAGSPEAFSIFPADTGTTVWFGIATYDVSGNRSVASIAGPITPVFDQSPTVVGPNPALGALGFGQAIAVGLFDDDDFVDIAVSAPGQNVASANSGAVYIFYGGPNGLAATPSVTIKGTGADQRTGTALGTVRWSSSTKDDLLVGIPTPSGDGRVVVFSHAALVGTKTIDDASFTISVSSTANWYTGGLLGSSIAVADFDRDGVHDVALSSPRGGGGVGGVTFVYGPIASSFALSDSVAPPGITAELMIDPAMQANHQFGFVVNALDDDLAIATADDPLTAGDSVYIVRGTGTRPPVGLSPRSFVIGRDVRIDLPTTLKTTNWGAQAMSLEDQNGDGTREIVVSASRDGTGRVVVINGTTLGTNGIAKTTDAGVAIATLTGATGVARFGAVLARIDAGSDGDVDGDGHEDLIAGGVQGTTTSLFVWFGHRLPVAATTVASTYRISGPANFQFPAASGVIGRASWLGDINHDGLDDVCWTSPKDTTADGGLQILLDTHP